MERFIRARPYLLWFLTEEEASEEPGLTEAAADGSDGTVVGSTMIKPPELQELSLSAHIFSEGFKTGSRGKRIQLQPFLADASRLSHQFPR